jgi:hypothetical protein
LLFTEESPSSKTVGNIKFISRYFFNYRVYTTLHVGMAVNVNFSVVPQHFR